MGKDEPEGAVPDRSQIRVLGAVELLRRDMLDIRRDLANLRAEVANLREDIADLNDETPRPLDADCKRMRCQRRAAACRRGDGRVVAAGTFALHSPLCGCGCARVAAPDPDQNGC